MAIYTTRYGKAFGKQIPSMSSPRGLAIGPTGNAGRFIRLARWAFKYRKGLTGTGSVGVGAGISNLLGTGGDLVETQVDARRYNQFSQAFHPIHKRRNSFRRYQKYRTDKHCRQGAARAAVEDVEEGCKIFGTYLETWLNGQGATGLTTQFVAVVVLLKSGALAPTAAQMLILQTYPNKKNILYTTQGVLGSKDNQSVPIIRDRIRIPKGKQRFGLGDSLNLIIAPVGQTIQNCGIAVYKEFE